MEETAHFWIKTEEHFLGSSWEQILKLSALIEACTKKSQVVDLFSNCLIYILYRDPFHVPIVYIERGKESRSRYLWN